MFTRAIEIATAFTNPYIGLRKRASGELFTTTGAFVVVNEEGWVLTSAHVVEEIMARRRDSSGESGVSDDSRVVATTEIWALPGFDSTHPEIAEAHVNPVADIALCRLEGIDSAAVISTPVFRDTTKRQIDQGMSVCRLGFPFYEVAATYDEERRAFDLGATAFPVPRFALDGIVARFNRRLGPDGKSSALFIETSTPGLRGQSGGPLLDTAGRVCGIQSHTTHIDLGFDAQYATPDGMVVERQFLNVGAATHVDEVRSLMDSAGVRYRLG
jgi:S1-C subfamily serine protease